MTLKTTVLALVLTCISGCFWATGSAGNIQKDPNAWGLIRYQPGRDSWFGITTGEEKAESKARSLAERNCSSGEIKVLKEGDVELTRSTIEKQVLKDGDVAKSGQSSRIISETEKRFRYKCSEAPADYDPPAMELNTIHETMQSSSTTVNIHNK